MKSVFLIVVHIICCIIFSSATAYCAPSISNYVDGIYIYSGINYGEPEQTEISYQFDIQIDTYGDETDPCNPYDTVDFVEITTPGVADGFTFQIPMLEDQWDDVNKVWTSHEYDAEFDPLYSVYHWYHSKSSHNANDLAKYGDGWYQINVHYTGSIFGGTSDKWFGVPGGAEPVAQPIQEPNIINYTNRDRLVSPVTFEWELCTDPNANSVWFGVESLWTYEDMGDSLDITATSYGPVDLNDGYWYINPLFDQGYSVGNDSDGIWYELGKYSESDYYFGFGILAELTGDNIVNFADFARVALRWLDCECDDWNLYCDRADLNFDYQVDYEDVKIIGEDWLASSGP